MEDAMSPQYSEVFEQFEKAKAERTATVLREADYVDEDGNPSEPIMKERVYQQMLDSCVVNSKAERSRKALTKGQLYTRAFPNGPGADEAGVDDLDEVDRAVFERLSSDVWGLTQTGRTGSIQRRLESDESTLVLCRTKVHRPTDKLLAVYLTDNEALIMEDAVDKEIKSWVSRASRLRKDLDMILSRHPGLRGQISSQLAVEMRKIDAELTLEPDKIQSNGKKQLAAPAA